MKYDFAVALFRPLLEGLAVFAAHDLFVDEDLPTFCCLWHPDRLRKRPRGRSAEMGSMPSRHDFEKRAGMGIIKLSEC